MKLKDFIKDYGDYDVVVSRNIATNEIVINGRKPRQKSVWDLKTGDVFWMDEGPRIDYSYWQDLDYENNFRDHGWIFLTKEECEADLERRKVETLLLKHGGRRWFKDGGMNWLMSYDREFDEWRFLYSTRDQRQGAIYFDSKVELIEAVEQIGRDRIIKALFEVR